jgi:hypothetical protein
MNKPSCAAVLCICVLASAASYGADPQQVVPLSEPADIRDASLMDQAIVRLSDKVMECVQRKLAADSACFCLYPQELSQVRETYEGTLKRHPEWKNATVSYFRDGKTFAVSMEGLSRQLEVKCPPRR